MRVGTTVGPEYSSDDWKRGGALGFRYRTAPADCRGLVL